MPEPSQQVGTEDNINNQIYLYFGGIYIQNAVLLDKRYSDSQKILFAYVQKHASENDGLLPDLVDISEDLNWTDGKSRRIMQGLRELGVIR